MELTTVANEVKLDLGCGARPAEGFEGVDLFEPTAKHRVNLFKFPWPWADSSVDAINSSHFVEHIPTCFVSGGNIPVDENDRDLWCAFFDECWRILKPGGRMTVIVPYLQSHRAFQDPTHRRFHCESNFAYLDKNWRVANGLTHYLGAADFTVMCDRIAPADEGLRHQEAAAMRAFHYWNTTLDVRANLVARK